MVTRNRLLIAVGATIIGVVVVLWLAGERNVVAAIVAAVGVAAYLAVRRRRPR